MTRRFLDQTGEMAERIRDHDWAATPLGPAEQWPEQLRFSVDLCLGSSFPTAIYWGPELRLIYNDAWAPIPADRHPWALGRPAAEVWADIWDVVGPQFAEVMRSGHGYATYDQLLMMERDGVPRETYWNYSIAAIRDDATRVLGILNQGNETTATVLAQRARAAETSQLRALFEQAPGAVAILEGPSHVFEIVNEAYQELVGADRALVGRPLAEAMPEVAEQGFPAILDRVLATGEPYRGWAVPVELRRGAGKEVETRLLDFVYQPILDAAGRPHRIFVQVTDNTERAQATERLRETEERLQLALDASAGLGVWDWDVGSDRVVAGGPFALTYGVPADVARSGISIETFLKAIHHDDRDRVVAAIRHALETGEPFSEEYRLLARGGAVRWVLAQGRPTLDDKGKPVRFPGVSFDITERKEAEEAARANADALRRTTDAQAFLFGLAEHQRQLDSPAAVMRLTAAALGRRLGVDRAGFYRVHGDEIEFGPNWTNGRLPPLRGRVTNLDLVDNVIDAYRTGRTVVIEQSNDVEHGPIRTRLAGAAVGVPLMRQRQWAATFFLNTARPRSWTRDEIALAEAVAEIAWDAVERAGAIVALRESEEQFRGIANSIDQMIWSTTPDGFHDYFNERWYEFTGVPPGSTDGDGWNDVSHPADRERAWLQWRQCLATGDPYHIEYRLKHHAGGYRWVLGRANPVRDEAGRIRRWFGTCTDIQDIVDAREVLARSRVELEALVDDRTRQLMAAEERLRHAQKMEAVGQLTGGIAHDFNNMLAVVIGALDLLERRLGEDRPDLKRYLDAAADGATRAAQLTQRLLAFARQQPLDPKPVDANAMVSDMLDLLSRTLGEQVRIEPVLAPELWWIEADPNQLENALLNLSVNARDAMAGGGALVLETANVSIDGEAGAAFEIAPGDYVQIAVTDTGSGMSADVAAKAFDPFFTTKGVGKGTGLGLSQVFGFVRQSGGTVKLESVPGRGTTVRLYLPRRDGAVPLPPAPRPPRNATLPLGRPGEVVMVVEDEERVRTFSVEALRELGYTVVHAASGAEALARLDAGQAINLLFTDVVMPEITGPELAEAVLARLPDIAVLFTSGYTGEAALTDAAGEPVTVLAKPFGVDALARRVRALLDR